MRKTSIISRMDCSVSPIVPGLSDSLAKFVTCVQTHLSGYEKVVANPEMIEPDREEPELEHRPGFLPGLDNRILRVIVDEPLRVITAFLDQSMKGKL